MPWVRFTRDYDFRPTSRRTIAYRADMTANVPRACAVDARAKGAAVAVKRPADRAEAEAVLAGDA